jgi:hypothetical protein
VGTKAINSSLTDTSGDSNRIRFDEECQKLDPREEQQLSDLGLAAELSDWPTYSTTTPLENQP